MYLSLAVTLGLFPSFDLCSTDRLQCSGNYWDNSGNKPAFFERVITVQMEYSCSPLDNIFIDMNELNI